MLIKVVNRPVTLLADVGKTEDLEDKATTEKDQETAALFHRSPPLMLSLAKNKICRA